MALSTPHTLDALVAGVETTRRLPSRLLMAFSIAALPLAGLGLYGVLSFLVQQRRREMGMRLARGASRAGVLRLIVGRGMRWAGRGLALGGCLALLLGRAMSGLLFDVSPSDPLILAMVGGLLGAGAPGGAHGSLQALRAE